MGLLYIMVLAVVFYYVIRYAVRDAIIEAKIKETELSYSQKVDEFSKAIVTRANQVVKNTTSKEVKEKAKAINSDTVKITTSDKPSQEKYILLENEESKLVLLENETDPSA